MSTSKVSFILAIAFVIAMPVWAQRRRMPQDSNEIVHLSEIRMRDVCILPDAASKTYYMIGMGWNSVRAYTSMDLKTWQGPKTIFRTPEDIWGDIRVVSIWAPELRVMKKMISFLLCFRCFWGSAWAVYRPEK